MTFRIHHEWKDGALLPANQVRARVVLEQKGVVRAEDHVPRVARRARLATCPHCKTLRVTEEGEGGAVHYIRIAKRSGEPWEDRLLDSPPPCIEPPPYHFAAPW